jgi:hypothetical protein
MSTRHGIVSYIHSLLSKQKTFHGQSEDVQVAMGKYELPKTLRSAIKKIFREWH